MSPRRRGRRHATGAPGVPAAPPGVAEEALATDDDGAETAPASVAVGGRIEADGRRASCTLAQLRRFIKSRPYVPIHELRRRFAIEGFEDEVSPFGSPSGTLYVGLPAAEAQLLGELVRGSEVGCELLLDPTCPAVVGVFPMRPVARL